MRRGLAVVVLAAFALHALQGVLLRTPWLLPDEVHASVAARSTVWEGFPSLWALLTWPLWAIGTGFGYEAAKLLGAAAVALTAFPAYGLARLVASERWSLIAAAGAALAPGTVIASTAHPVAMAYPLVAAATYLVVKRDNMRAAAFGLLAVLVWPPLFLPALAVAVVAFVRSRPLRSLLEWPDAAVFVVVPAVLYAAIAGGRLASGTFERATDAWHKIPLAAGASLGALALGLALVPVIAAVAALVRRHDQEEPRTSLTAVTVVEVVALLVVAAMLGLGRSGGERVADEIALVFTLPALLAVAAGSLARVGRRELGIAAAVVAVAVLLVPGADRHAPGLQLGESLGLGPWGYGLALVLVGANLLVALRLLGRRHAAPAVLTAVVASLALLGELAAWDSARELDRVDSVVADSADGRRVTVLRAKAPGDLVNGFVFWTPNAELADPPLVTREVDPVTGLYNPPLPPGLVFDFGGGRVAGTLIARTAHGVLVDAGEPVRAAETVEGLYEDRWSTGDAYYRRFGGEQRPGTVFVHVSRAGWRGPSPTAQVVISVRPFGGDPFAERITSIRSGQTRTVELPVPPPPFEVKVAIGPTFSPVDYGGTDDRQLGAQLLFDYRLS